MIVSPFTLRTMYADSDTDSLLLLVLIARTAIANRHHEQPGFSGLTVEGRAISCAVARRELASRGVSCLFVSPAAPIKPVDIVAKYRALRSYRAPVLSRVA